MGIDTTHRLYKANQQLWSIMRDTIEGEHAVKGQDEVYLPRPSSSQRVIVGGVDRGELAYQAYKTRASFVEGVRPTQQGVVGMLHRRDAEYQIAPVQYMEKMATSDGYDLAGLHRSITEEVMAVGRYGLLTDSVGVNGKPFIATYPAENILNWRTEFVDGIEKLVSVMLLEGVEVVDEQDKYNTDLVKRYRYLTIEGDGFYRQEISTTNKEGKIVTEETVEPKVFGGKRMTEIPFQFFGSSDLRPDPNQMPLLGISRTLLGSYRNSADYEHALYLTSLPTPVIKGMNSESSDAPNSIGPSNIWFLGADGDAKYLEFSGAGVAAQKTEIDTKLARAMQMGATLVETSFGQPESGEALRRRQGDKTANLVHLAKNIAEGLEQSLRYAAMFVGTKSDQIKIIPNMDFSDNKLDSQQLMALVNAWSSGAFSFETLHYNLKQGELTTLTADQERSQIESDGPASGMGLSDEDDEDESDESEDDNSDDDEKKDEAEA